MIALLEVFHFTPSIVNRDVEHCGGINNSAGFLFVAIDTNIYL